MILFIFMLSRAHQRQMMTARQRHGDALKKQQQIDYS